MYLLHIDPSHTFGEYTVNESIMPSNITVRDLEVFIENKLNFHEHVSIFTMKVNRVLAVMYIILLSIWIIQLLLTCITNHSSTQF